MIGVKRLLITSALAAIFVNIAGAEEFKPSRIVHTQTEGKDITQTITVLNYDGSGRLVKFIEYDVGHEADPRFNIDLVWNTNEVIASGLVDYDEANVTIYLNGTWMYFILATKKSRQVSIVEESRNSFPVPLVFLNQLQAKCFVLEL